MVTMRVPARGTIDGDLFWEEVEALEAALRPALDAALREVLTD